MARTPTEWVRMFDKAQSTHTLAHTILGDLLGYNKKSVHRVEDGDNLTFALEAAMVVARRTPAEMTALVDGNRDAVQHSATALNEAATALRYASHALSKYGQHFTTCEHVKGRACTCGLDAIKAKLA